MGWLSGNSQGDQRRRLNASVDCHPVNVDGALSRMKQRLLLTHSFLQKESAALTRRSADPSRSHTLQNWCFPAPNLGGYECGFLIVLVTFSSVIADRAIRWCKRLNLCVNGSPCQKYPAPTGFLCPGNSPIDNCLLSVASRAQASDGAGSLFCPS